MIEIEYEDDGTLPALLKPRVVARMPKYPGVETHLIRFEPRPGVVEFCLRDFLVLEGAWRGSYVVPPHTARDLIEAFGQYAAFPERIA